MFFLLGALSDAYMMSATGNIALLNQLNLIRQVVQNIRLAVTTNDMLCILVATGVCGHT